MTTEEWLTYLQHRASAATPGPYHRSTLGDRSGFAHVATGSDSGPGQTVAQWMLPQDADFLASFSPDVVLKLLRVARAARALDDDDLHPAARPTIKELLEALAGLEQR